MNRLFASLLAFGICLTPATGILTPHTVLAQNQDLEALLQQAIQYTQEGKPQQAIETFQQVLRLAQQKGDRVSEAFAHLGLGLNYINIGQPQTVLAQYNQALSIFREIKDRSWEATILNNIGLVYDNIGKPEEALKYYNQALPILREVGNHVQEATTLGNIGLVYDNIGKPEEALKYYNQSLPITREVGDRAGEATTLSNIGLVYDNIGKPEEALKYYNQALSITREVGDRAGEATTLNNIGIVFSRTGKPEEALEYYNQVLSILREVGDHRLEATALSNIGTVYGKIGKPEKALKYYSQALPITREVGDRAGEATILSNIGGVYDSISKPEEALEYYNQALPITREVGDRSGEATTLNNIGIVYGNIGKPEEALEYYNQALPITRQVGDRRVEAATLTNIGLVFSRTGKPEEALKFYSQALPITREVGDRSGEATTLNDIGAVYDNIGKPEEALKFYNQALPIMREVGDRSLEATTLNNIGFVYDNIGKPEEALKFYNQALPIMREVGDRSLEATTLNNIGAVSSRIGKPEEALKYYNQALPITKEVGDRSGEATTLNNIGIVYGNIGKPEEALKYYNQALPITKEVGDRSGEETILSNIGLVYRDTNQPEKAIAIWEESTEITLSIRQGLNRDNRKEFIEAKDDTAVALIDILIKQNQPEKAFEWANRVTTFDLADYTRLINAKVANPEAQQEIDQWNELNQQLTFLQNQQEENNRQGKYSTELAQRINEIQAQANQKAEDISRRFPEVAELFETTPTDIKKLQQNLPQNTVVIQPVLLTGVEKVPNTVAIFVLTQDKLTVIQKPLPDDFGKLITDFRQQLETISSYRDTGAQLYDILIRPVEEQFLIPSGYQIAIIATGKLRNIPFEPLYDLQTDKHLLEKYPVSYLTRLSKTQNAKLVPAKAKIQNERQSLTALVIADPKPTQQELTGTEVEADYIMQNFPGSQDYRHEQATLDTFKKQALGFSILHLGTHGCFIREGCPSIGMKPNTLLFANNQQYPIADAALLGLTKTELLVLSACQTAQITDVEGIGLSGLAYIWERAGAKSIIASLWNAADEDSSEVMTKFYANLKQGMSKAEAIRRAKLSLINNQKPPFLWSPFILIGDAQ